MNNLLNEDFFIVNKSAISVMRDITEIMNGILHRDTNYVEGNLKNIQLHTNELIENYYKIKSAE